MTAKPTSNKDALKGFIVLIVLVVLINRGCHCVNNNSNDTDSKKSAITVPLLSAVQINKYYHDNEVLADQKFKGQRIKVTGVVTSIAKNAFDDIYVTLSSGEFLQEVHFTNLPESVAAALKKGENVTIEGECQGLFMGSVSFDKCEMK